MNLEKKFYIINDVDRPCEKLVVQRTHEDRAEYCNEDMRDWSKRHGVFVLDDSSTPIEDFGFKLELIEEENAAPRRVKFTLVGESSATYSDGAIRHWQGSVKFVLPII